MFLQDNPKPTFFRVQGNTAILYKGALDFVGKRAENGKNLDVDRLKAYQGKVSSNSIRVARRRLSEWLEVLRVGNSRMRGRKVRLVLLTVTLASRQDFNGSHSDKMVKSKLLEPLLKFLQYNFDVKNYFWRAEPQGNGNIHFHIVCDRFLDKDIVQDYWNMKLDEYGLMDDFKAEYGRTNPPSSHVKSFGTSPAEIDYLVKYVTKNENSREIKGLQMRFSNSIKFIEPISTSVTVQEEFNLLDTFEKLCNDSVSDDFFKLFYFDKPVIDLFPVDKMFPVFDHYRWVMYRIIYHFDLTELISRLVRWHFVTSRPLHLSDFTDEDGVILASSKILDFLRSQRILI